MEEKRCLLLLYRNPLAPSHRCLGLVFSLPLCFCFAWVLLFIGYSTFLAFLEGAAAQPVSLAADREEQTNDSRPILSLRSSSSWFFQ